MLILKSFFFASGSPIFVFVAAIVFIIFSALSGSKRKSYICPHCNGEFHFVNKNIKEGRCPHCNKFVRI